MACDALQEACGGQQWAGAELDAGGGPEAQARAVKQESYWVSWYHSLMGSGWQAASRPGRGSRCDQMRRCGGAAEVEAASAGWVMASTAWSLVRRSCRCSAAPAAAVSSASPGRGSAAGAAGAGVAPACRQNTAGLQHQAAAVVVLPAVVSWRPLGLAPRCRVRMLRLQGSALTVKREDRPSMAAEEGAICHRVGRRGTQRSSQGEASRQAVHHTSHDAICRRGEGRGRGGHGSSGSAGGSYSSSSVRGADAALPHGGLSRPTSLADRLNTQRCQHSMAGRSKPHLAGLLEAVLVFGVVRVQEDQLSLGQHALRPSARQRHCGGRREERPAECQLHG